MKFFSFTKRFQYILYISCIGFIITALMVTTYRFPPVALQQLDYSIYDHFLALEANGKVHPVPIIVDIDEKSLKEVGQWPWNRNLMAELINNLLDAGALSVTLDIVLSEPDRTSPILLKEDLHKRYNIDLDLEQLPEQFQNNDIYFANSIKNKPVVLGTYLDFSTNSQGNALLGENATREEIRAFKKFLRQITPKSVAIKRPETIAPMDVIEKASSITLPLEEIAKNGSIGFFNVQPDADGTVRRVPMIANLDGVLIPPLSVQAIMAAAKIKNLDILSDHIGLTDLRIGKTLNVPISRNGFFYVPFKGPGKTYPYYSAADILNKKVPTENLQGKIVLIGTSSPGLLDLRSTPLDLVYPGVEIHATIIDAILSQNFLSVPNWTQGAQLLLILIAGLIFTFLFAKIRSSYTITTIFLFIASSFGSSWYLFTQNYFVSPLWFSLELLLLAMSITIFRFWWEEKEKKKLRNMFGRYVSPEVISQMLEKGDQSLYGEQREVTIMFTDLRGFTSMSEKLAPTEVVSMLNSYFTPMTSLVKEHEGTLDKFIGDAIMAFWNAPLTIDNHPTKAVQTGLAMLDRLEIINQEINEKYNILLDMGIGIHTGAAYAGNMGSENLTSYTVIGDNVNLTSRLEGLCSQLGLRMIISENTKNLYDGDVIPIGNITVKGKKEAIAIYTVLTQKEKTLRSQETEEYLQAYALYNTCVFERNIVLLDEVIQKFEDMLEKYTNNKLYQAFHSFCFELKKSDPETWTNIWNFSTK